MPDFLFLDKSTQPTESQLKEAIADTYEYWIEIKKRIAELYGDTKGEWKFYSKQGWLLYIGSYDEGKRVGEWFILNKNGKRKPLDYSEWDF